MANGLVEGSVKSCFGAMLPRPGTLPRLRMTPQLEETKVGAILGC
jgi:hypothetical protein